MVAIQLDGFQDTVKRLAIQLDGVWKFFIAQFYQKLKIPIP